MRTLQTAEAALVSASPQIASTQRERPLKIVCLGDSITGCSDLSSYLKFSHLLELMLEVRHGRVIVVNKGIGGDSSAGVLARLQRDVFDENPDIVILLIGGNDASAQVAMTPEATAHNLRAILSALRGAGIRVLALQYHILPNLDDPTAAWRHLARNNDVIAREARACGYPVLDMGEPMRAASQIQPHGELVDTLDGVHLRPGGELVFARAMFDELEKLGWLETNQ